MPVYEYRCKQCGRHHEIEHGFHDERPSQCPSCGGHLVRVFHPVGVVFKGSGFYKTDSTSSGARKEPTTSGSGSKASSDGKAGEGKGEAKTESKPAGESKSSPTGSGTAKSGSSGT